MNIFKKIKNKMNIIPSKSWDDVTLEQFYKIKDILEVQDKYTVLNLIDIIYGIDSSALPAKDLDRYVKKLQFLNEEIKGNKPSKHYKLNGREYDCHYDLTVISTAQFLDYQNYSKDNKPEDILTVFIFPKGHEYNDGYDIEQVKEDIMQMPITEVYNAAFFFAVQLKIYVNRFQHYLSKNMKKQGMKESAQCLKKINLQDLVLFPSFLNTANQQTKHSQQPYKPQ